MTVSVVGPAAGLSTRRRARPFRHQFRIATAVAGAVLVLLGSACSPAAEVPAGQTTVTTAPGAGAPAGSDGGGVPQVPGSSLVATARGARVAVHTAPDGAVKRTLANPTAIGAPLTFLVLQSRTGWLRVALPLRPNGSSGWIARDDVSLSSTPYRLVLSRSKHRLDVNRAGHRIARYPVGVGTSTTPTPVGTYYLTELIQPPDPAGAYGPYAFGLSAFSDTLTSFAGGPGQLGLHGTDAPKGLGHDVSHGCLRVANAVITRLAGQIPLGTPIEIRA